MKVQKIQGKTTFAEIDELIVKHLQARDWDDLTQRAVAISLSLEANELLEHFQWGEEPVGDKEALADELADILIYAFEFAQITGIDMAEAIKRKLAKSAAKYPAEQFKGKGDDARLDAYLQAKLSHQKTGL